MSLLVLAICAAGRSADADIVYVSSGDVLGTIDLTTGAVTGIGSTTENLYGLGVGADGNRCGLSSAAKLYRVDTTTAALTLVGDYTGNFSGGAAFGAGLDGTLYATNGIGNLWSVDPNSGAATLIGNMGVSTNTNPSGGPGSSLYLTSGSLLYRVDPATAAPALVGAGSYPILYSLASTDNTLYGIDRPASGNEIWSLNTANGSSMLVATYDAATIGGISGIAVMPTAVPEPASLVMLGTGGAALLGAVRWHRARESTAA